MEELRDYAILNIFERFHRLGKMRGSSASPLGKDPSR